MVSDFRPIVPSGANDLFAGGGEMGELMHSIDWSQTPLGPKEEWPQSLRTSLSICLASRFPILIWWGSELVMLYNDAYRPMLGATKHPQAMGQRGKECWPEIWDVIGPMLEGVLNRGEATWSDDQLLLLNRNGYIEECYFTFSYSPIRDESGGIGGVFTAVTETTGRVLGERRLRTLRELAAESTEAHTAEEVCQLAVKTLATNPNDLPFTLLYLLNEQGTQARLAGSSGIVSDIPVVSAVIALADQNICLARPLSKVVASGKAILIEQLPENYAALLTAVEGEPQRSVLILPIARPGQESLYGFLIAGVAPRRALDDDYRSFFDLVAGQIAANIASVQAYQEERARAEALAELDRAKTTFFSNVSHEFRTPLTLLLGPVADALTDEAHPLDTEQRERLEMVQRNGLRLLKLVNSLLDFARIEAGRIEAIYEPVDLATFTAELASNFRSAIERAGMRLIVDCPPLAEPVYVDREMWEKIVLNLLSNAFKFTFEGEIVVSLHASEQVVELEVRDTGVGIAQEELPRIFERFHRVYNTRARTFEGTGIGLSLVQELVRLHGGTIRASSVAGEGTAFIVSLPRGTAHLPPERINTQERALSSTALGAAPYVEEAMRWLPAVSGETTVSPVWTDQAQALAATPTTMLDLQQTARVLVIDDNSDMLEYVSRLLSPYYSVETATDGRMALQAIERRRPNLIISDVMMPELDGLQLLQILRSQPETSLLPVILLSARAGEEATIEGLQAGANDYLVKPFSARELLTRVAARLEIAHLFQQVQQALRSRDELFSLVTHDLKNPLGAIKGYAQLAHRQLTQADAQPQIVSLLTRIDALSSRMTAQINELLELAQLQTSQPPRLSLRPVDLVALVCQVITEQQQTTSHRIVLKTTRDSLSGQFDAMRLERILTNLLSNAIKYSPEGGAIEVSLEQQEVQGRPCAIIRVRDYGIGIPADDLPHIFEPFHRAANVSGKIAGTGLGLSSVQQMVMHHGGAITVESQERHGSTFTVRLPLNPDLSF
ncbi:MAG TPA: ATP-binding protein [Ktedonobacteraceae bacterium]|nr:ATP-binding protein [Ktedonobacteraceae bacterium]